jgi:6-phosphogluconolactonase
MTPIVHEVVLMKVQYPKTKYFETAEWPMLVADLIQDSVATILRKEGRCCVALTGGRSAERLYLNWSELPAFRHLSGVNFYFGDERCVPPNSRESNYGMAKRTLFQQGVPNDCAVFRMEADDTDREAAARRYGETLPDELDILLLGVGDDGHIASLFPDSVALHEKHQRVLPICAPNAPYERLTITPSVIAQTSSIFVLASGAAKAAVLRKATQDPSDFLSLPARLVLNATWLLDTALPEEIVK